MMHLDLNKLPGAFTLVTGKTSKFKTICKIIFCALAVTAAVSTAVAVLKSVQVVKLKNKVRLLSPPCKAEDSEEGCIAEAEAVPVTVADPQAADCPKADGEAAEFAAIPEAAPEETPETAPEETV